MFVIFFAVFLQGAPGVFLSPNASAPVATLKDLNEKEQTFPVAGKWNVIFFWSLFCQTCIDEMPIFSEELKALRDLPLESFFITLDTAKMKKGVENFLKKRNFNLNVLLEEIASDSYKSADLWGVKMTPSTFFIDPEGKIVFSKEGPFDPAELFNLVRKALASQTEKEPPELK